MLNWQEDSFLLQLIRHLCLFSTQLIDMFGSLLHRPAISKHFAPKYVVLVTMVNEDLDATKRIFDSHQSAMEEFSEENGEHNRLSKVSLVDKNMPPVAGLLKWSQELRNRVEGPVAQLLRTDHG